MSGFKQFLLRGNVVPIVLIVFFCFEALWAVTAKRR